MEKKIFVIGEETKKAINREYMAIRSFRNGELERLAEKYGITVGQLMDIIEL